MKLNKVKIKGTSIFIGGEPVPAPPSPSPSPSPSPADVTYLMVGGGGGGGQRGGGGGGGGGVVTGVLNFAGPGSVAITIGAGGLGGSQTSAPDSPALLTDGSPGSNTFVGTSLVAYGGGGGGGRGSGPNGTLNNTSKGIPGEINQPQYIPTSSGGGGGVSSSIQRPPTPQFWPATIRSPTYPASNSVAGNSRIGAPGGNPGGPGGVAPRVQISSFPPSQPTSWYWLPMTSGGGGGGASNTTSPRPGAGGGGRYNPPSFVNTGGFGGRGFFSPLTGSYFGGGGGGGGAAPTRQGYQGGAGGLGGGGAGGSGALFGSTPTNLSDRLSAPATSGTANTGGGGGGSGNSRGPGPSPAATRPSVNTGGGLGGSGGSGVVVLQYPGGTQRGSFSPAGPVITDNPGAYVRHTITGSTSWNIP